MCVVLCWLWLWLVWWLLCDVTWLRRHMARRIMGRWTLHSTSQLSCCISPQLATESKGQTVSVAALCSNQCCPAGGGEGGGWQSDVIIKYNIHRPRAGLWHTDIVTIIERPCTHIWVINHLVCAHTGLTRFLLLTIIAIFWLGFPRNYL